MKRFMTSLLVLVLMVMFVGCVDSTSRKEKAITENQQNIHLKTTPPPVLKDSLERRQLIRRLKRFNKANKISYIYLVSALGQMIGYYTIKGKVSSVNSLLTTPEVRLNGHASIVPSPDLDGSYGSNGDAIFFFTSTDVYVEWNGTYLLSDKPLPIKAIKF